MAYVDTDELSRVLKIANPSSEQTAAMQRVLDAATREIDDEIDLRDDSLPLTDEGLALAEQVCIQRASELWFLQEVPLGLAGIGSEFGTAHLSRNSWEKYAFTLAPLKEQFGIA
jgi:hypothetical protein